MFSFSCTTNNDNWKYIKTCPEAVYSLLFNYWVTGPRSRPNSSRDSRFDIQFCSGIFLWRRIITRYVLIAFLCVSVLFCCPMSSFEEALAFCWPQINGGPTIIYVVHKTSSNIGIGLKSLATVDVKLKRIYKYMYILDFFLRIWKLKYLKQ